MNLVYGSFCPLHEGNERCPCRTLTTNASIWTAAELGDVERVRTVVTVKGRGPDSLDPHGYTPLHLAAQNGRLSAVLYLLEAGASPDGVCIEAGGCGATPLHRAAFAGQLPCVRALLSAGASTSAADASFLDMKTPLHKAAAQGHRDVCVALMEAGADPNACDAAGNSALDVLSLSAPDLSDAEVTPSPLNKGSGGGGGGGGTEACSIVVLSSREEKDWGGVREALVRHGGCQKLGKAHIGSGKVGGGEDGGGSIAHSSSDPSASRSGGREGVAARRQESKPAPSPSLLAPKEADGVSDVGVGGSGGTLAGPARSFSTEVDEKELNEVRAAAAPALAPLTGRYADAPRSEHGSNRSAGMPCGECLLPKVVMVRASCCVGLLCKPCVRDICARRHSCRRCRGTNEDP